jgi:hypothetical protein
VWGLHRLPHLIRRYWRETICMQRALVQATILGAVEPQASRQGARDGRPGSSRRTIDAPAQRTTALSRRHAPSSGIPQAFDPSRSCHATRHATPSTGILPESGPSPGSTRVGLPRSRSTLHVRSSPLIWAAPSRSAAYAAAPRYAGTARR